ARRLEPAAAGVLLLALQALPTYAVDQPRARELERLVRQDCGSCHGITLKGGLGKPLLPKALAPLSEAQVEAVILEGIPGTPMPPWKGLLSADD
ncbi:cytochrome c, partial [Enterococcus faecium]|uniref:c-type cytochrome n=1 Tax=Enterococcus faecium TaxID=1352 RepID=UPI003F425A22